MPRPFHLEGGGVYDYIRVVDDFIDVRYANHNYPEVQDEKITALSVHNAVNKKPNCGSRIAVTDYFYYTQIGVKVNYNFLSLEI